MKMKKYHQKRTREHNFSLLEMNQWKKGAIPKNTRDFNEDVQVKQNKFLVYREYMEEISVEKLRQVIDSHWKDFE